MLHFLLFSFGVSKIWNLFLFKNEKVNCSIFLRTISTIAPKDKEKDLVIPLIKKNNWRIPTSEKAEKNDNQDPESKLNDLAVQELLKGKYKTLRCLIYHYYKLYIVT